MDKKNAFTLAEVLVTLGILGVVAAVTMPTLINNHQRKVHITQLRKFYTELSQASIRYMSDHNALSMKEAGLRSQQAAEEFINQYFNVVQTCTSQSDCMSVSYKKISGAQSWNSSRTKFAALSSGASFGYGYVTNNNYYVMSFDLDTNGAKGPNVVGRDFFVIYLYNDGKIDEAVSHAAPATREERESVYNSGCAAANSNWSGCFGKILNDNWEMNY